MLIKNVMLKMIKKRVFLLYWKMFVWIKEDRDSVTRPKSENVEKKLKLGSCMHHMHSDKAWFIRHFWALHVISYFLYHACIICIVIHLVKYLMPNSFPKVKECGRLFGSSDQCHRKYPRRIRAWHPRDEGTTGQTDKLV